MFKKIYFKKTTGAEKNARKRGFTLVELCVVILLSTLIVTMIVTFSTLIGEYSADSNDRVSFFEDSAIFKAKLSEWMSLYDMDDGIFKIGDDAKFQFTHMGGGEHIHELKFHQGTMEIGNLKVENLNSIDKVEFFVQDSGDKRVIKCVLYRYNREGALIDESVLIFAPHCAKISGGTEAGADE